MKGFVSNYNKFPVVKPRLFSNCCWEGWEKIGQLAQELGAKPGKPNHAVALECYPGVHEEDILDQLKNRLNGTFILAKDYLLSEEKIKTLVYPDVTDDELFGHITSLQLDSFFDSEKLSALSIPEGENIFVFGIGATIVCKDPAAIVYFDMPRWEGQLRFRRNEVDNLGISNRNSKASLQYKQAFYVDWRVCDNHKKKLMPSWDLVVDTTLTSHPKITTGDALRNAYRETVSQPFRLVPFFDPGPWGGQWMKKYCNLNTSEKNYAWCFDCVPEENSLLIQFGDLIFESPAINLVFFQPEQLLGAAVHQRFGEEFPIRFDFLDTIEGGNLSLQVHPTNDYILEHFGMEYTQDESYYILDAEPDAVVYIGLIQNIDPGEMIGELKAAQAGAADFNADKFVAKFPVKKHDHVLIPSGTVHCSGRNSMVLEISATPYMFTFKLWDWGRMGLDGKLRPINIEHGKKVINWSTTGAVAEKELINVFQPIAEGEGWREERTGLHPSEFIETRRHWFTGMVAHHAEGNLNVLNLVEGREVIVESPGNAFEPYVVHYAETFVVPAQAGAYTIRPYGESEGKLCATLKAYVRVKV